MSWVGPRERGSLVLLRFTFWLVRTAGWHAGQALLYPITLYFYLSSPAARVVSRDYLARVLPRAPGRADIIRHFFTFACVLLDRIFFLGGRTGAYVLDSQGVEALTEILAERRGCVLLGAHLGSFDMLRAFGRNSPVVVNPVMFRQPGGVFSRLIEALDPELAARVIDIAQPGAILRVQECIERGEIVGFLGDRFPDRQAHVTLTFLGGTAVFPTGPLVLASMLRAPVVLFYGVRTGPRRYHVQFQPFADRIDLRRASRAEDVRGWVQAYADALAAACREHPYNWFNFFPFWQDA
jgi:predicted LPLAT superfamily acyltransferase